MGGGGGPSTKTSTLARGDVCETVDFVAQQWQTLLETGHRSSSSAFYEPYLSFLYKQVQTPHLIPRTWSPASQEFLKTNILAWNTTSDKAVLPPAKVLEAGPQCPEPTHYHGLANLVLTYRSWDEVLIPVYDMVSHANGPAANLAERHSVHDTRQANITIYATHDIPQGDELAISYNACPLDCQGRAKSWYGTPELFRDYGFVEAYPQKWSFRRHVSIGLDNQCRADNHNKTTLLYHFDDPCLKFWWIRQPKTMTTNVVDFMERQAVWLQQQQQQQQQHRPVEIPLPEWTVLVQYQAALLVAVQRTAVEARRLWEQQEAQEPQQ